VHPAAGVPRDFIGGVDLGLAPARDVLPIVREIAMGRHSNRYRQLPSPSALSPVLRGKLRKLQFLPTSSVQLDATLGRSRV
jgi:hypothetical protein